MTRVIAISSVVAALGVTGAVLADAQTGGLRPPPQTAPPPAYEPVVWRRSKAIGEPWAGRLRRGVQLPPEGPDFFTWNPVDDVAPNRGGRRWGHDRLIRKLLRVLRAYRADNPGAPRVGIGDLSRRRGGVFDERFGGLGHKSHQNGLDVDVYHPRMDRLELRPARPSQVDQVLAQGLVRRFVAARARYVFVGPRLKPDGSAWNRPEARPPRRPHARAHQAPAEAAGDLPAVEEGGEGASPALGDPSES